MKSQQNVYFGFKALQETRLLNQIWVHKQHFNNRTSLSPTDYCNLLISSANSSWPVYWNIMTASILCCSLLVPGLVLLCCLFCVDLYWLQMKNSLLAKSAIFTETFQLQWKIQLYLWGLNRETRKTRTWRKETKEVEFLLSSEINVWRTRYASDKLDHMTSVYTCSKCQHWKTGQRSQSPHVSEAWTRSTGGLWV